jgi:CSLREA domain-containing protein
MMPSITRVSWRGRGGPIVHNLSATVVVVAIGVFAGCSDGATRISAPPPPELNVSSNGTWMVNSLDDPGDGVCSNKQCTLREALASAQNGERITFKGNLSGTIALTAGALPIDQGVIIDGPGADKLTVNAQNAHRVIHIGAVNPVIVTISGVTITGGSVPSDVGGGIQLMAGSRLVLIGSLVTGNSAVFGAGIHSLGTLTLVGSTIAENNASASGGGIVNSGAPLTISRSTISANSAAVGGGGGILAVCEIDCGSGVTIRSSTITTNDAAAGGGGGIFFGGPISIFNTIIAGNRVNGDPAALDADCNEHPVSLGYNLSTQNTGCQLTGPTDVVVALPSQVFTFVLEPVLANNGSPRKTHALIERGFAVDAGYCPGENGDQRGFPRPYDDLRMPNALDGCDIGAFEWQPADTKTKGPKP